MARRRSKLEIYLDVLGVIKNGANRPTWIMERVNLSREFSQMVINSMLSQELIKEMEFDGRVDTSSTQAYIVTQKGDNILRYFSRNKEFPSPSVDRFLTKGDYSSLSSFDISLDLSFLILLCQKS